MTPQSATQAGCESSFSGTADPDKNDPPARYRKQNLIERLGVPGAARTTAA